MRPPTRRLHDLLAGKKPVRYLQPVAISPNGCRIAFDPRQGGAIGNGVAAAPTVKVIALCDGSVPAASGPEEKELGVAHDHALVSSSRTWPLARKAVQRQPRRS